MAPSRNATFTKSFVRKPGAPRGDTSIPIRTEAPPPLRQPTKMQRSKTLTRPERQQPQVPLINPQTASGSEKTEAGSPAWRNFSIFITCWAFPPCLSACGMKDKPTQQAWREKVTLVFLALLMGGFVGFITMALNRVLCPSTVQESTKAFQRIGASGGLLGINGWDFDIAQAALPDQQQVGVNLYTLAGNTSGYDITPLFSRTAQTHFPACIGKTGAYATSDLCKLGSASTLASCPLKELSTANLASLKMVNTSRRVGYDWKDLGNATFKNYIVLDGNVLNLGPYMNSNPDPIPGDNVDLAIRTQLNSVGSTGGRDATRLFYTTSDTKNAVKCLTERYYAGHIDKLSPGCFVSDLFLYVSLIIILGLVLVRFLMAIYFSWFLSARMSAPPKDDGSRRFGQLNTMPKDAMNTVDSAGEAPWAAKQNGIARNPQARHLRPKNPNMSDSSSSAPSINTLTAQNIGNEPWIMCLVTCYSEDEEGISTTLTSLAECDYPAQKKLLFVVADGMVTGSGQSQSTPDVCVSLLESDPRFGTPIPMSFVSVAQGKKAHNMAMVYAGHYNRGSGAPTPMVVVVKCGTPEESTQGKPGNRGKRDSQMILMNFLQRVTYNDRMTPLDFDLFRKVHALMGVTPDFFELLLMVDADTKVFPAGLRKLSNAMMRDHIIMGACGETRIANKMSSWVTAIQVYEYFISHHMVKSFESVFGGVTCLPGCFSMYRIKARKPSDDDWVPIIVKPEVTREYSQSIVRTLHQKNLLLLGEDRFLTTTLLRTFPNRKMVFVPQARCRTEVPHTFKMLLSQRRRWINSTIHNLMELVLVKDLCGTFCFSMQFVVFMDLIGTAVLPIAISLTYVLIVSYCLSPPTNFSQAIPLMLLIAVIGLPAVLILLATRKVVYVMWMMIYLIFLPVWNFILPVYAFWHFDDFSWGETRKVEGEAKGEGHGDGEGVFAAASVPLRRWEDWELSRLKKQKREVKRRNEMERQFGGRFWNDQSQQQQQQQQQQQWGGQAPVRNGRGGPQQDMPGGLAPMHRYRESDSFSDTTEEDVWGAQIGVYEDSAPPPTRIVRHTMVIEDGELLAGGDLEAMMEKGFDDDPSGNNSNLMVNGSKRTSIHGGPMPRQPLAPSANQARRSQRFSKMPPMPTMPHQWSSPANGGGLPPRGSDDYAHGRRDPLSAHRTPSPSSAMGEEISLMRSTATPSPMPSPGPGGGGFQLQDLGPTPSMSDFRSHSPSSPFADPPRGNHMAASSAVQGSYRLPHSGAGEGHARQRSQGSGAHHYVPVGNRSPGASHQHQFSDQNSRRI
ncbi:unnamed protein product [Sympodiomycopsis kandeliae]